ncbi:phospholipase D-like domain-containing protein [Flavobacterium hercynium]|uniref:phospholipase D-like domain-containing protein n=1 Tax=Flavobacterium hercynium TaxID=387094 RepID=UPI000B5BBFAC|nr:phospholipase D-like domain-containing protein [Flavobacterium hercynium]SMP20351.1 Phosphatidylserine/phosphatidylglycerophosphate/cardiolipin synthase [Flavobacterium hercynium]
MAATEKSIIKRILEKDEELRKEIFPEVVPEIENLTFKNSVNESLKGTLISPLKSIVTEEHSEESIILSHLRPVMLIRDNKIVPEFSGPDSTVWKERLFEKSSILDQVIPAIGRIEVNRNAVYKWVGTGWLVDHNIIITNRHVAQVFCNNKDKFTFKAGYPDGLQSSQIDFLEESSRNVSLEYEIENVIWISENTQDDPDVAFLKIRIKPGGPALPKPLLLAGKISEGEVVVTVGYPARDPNIPDQDLVLRIFGNVYDKKRLAPGEITSIDSTTITHDCSTLGGNSGSPVIVLSTGEVAGLHFAGLYMKENFAVPASKIRELLDKLHQGTLPRMNTNQHPANESEKSIQNPSVTPNSLPMKSYTFEVNIPIKVTVEVGNPALPGLTAPQSDTKASYEQAVAAAKETFSNYAGVIDVISGYRFKRGWITDEKVIVVEVEEKKDFPQLKASGTELLPQEFLGYGIDVRTAGLTEQLTALGVNLSLVEELPRPGLYRPPSGFGLLHITEEMEAIFHVSPDSGWPNLKSFIERTKETLTATIYEWEAEHINKTLSDAITEEKKLKMITQKPGTKEAVEELSGKLKDRFKHVWASVGSNKIVPTAYHIKVASRDDKEFWLSSGNWKNSNQADIHPAKDKSTSMTPLLTKNREWHAIIENVKLATMFRQYIDWDFEEAKRLPLEEAVTVPEMYFFVAQPVIPIEEAKQAAKYFNPLEFKGMLDVQVLLTPDRNERNESIFLSTATELIESAKHTIDIENQSFNMLKENESQFERFFSAIVKQQEKGIKVRIIFRDPREFNFKEGSVSLQRLLDRLKDFGFDTDNIKVQRACHTKAIIIDSEDNQNAAVLFGSHNLTTSGTLYNRDASLLVRNQVVSKYYQQIFDYDWENLAKQNAEETTGKIIIAKENETAPAGFDKVSLKEILGLV